MTGRRCAVLRLAFLLVLASACEGNDGPPRLELYAVEGAPALAAQPVVEASFQVRSTGSGRLHLRAVIDDCACHAAVVGSDVLDPGQRSTIAARCRVVPGADAVRRLRLHSNDPEHAMRVLPVRVPEGGPAARPAAVSFGYVRIGRVATREIVVPHAPPSMRLAAGADVFTLEPGTRGGDGSRSYRVRFAPEAPGVVRTTLEYAGDALPIAVVGVGFADLAAYPAEVRTPSAVAEDLPELFLKNMTGTPVEIARIDFPPDVTGELQTVVEGEEFRVRLRSARGHTGAHSPGVIRVHTTGDGPPTLSIPVLRTSVGELPGN